MYVEKVCNILLYLLLRWIFVTKARDRNRKNLYQLERQLLEQKHQLERNMEGAQWELEEAQLAEKHTLITQQLRVN